MNAIKHEYPMPVYSETGDKHKDQIFKMTREAFEYVSGLYNSLFYERCDPNVNILQRGRDMYPMWMNEIGSIESAMNSYEHTVEEFERLCTRYKNGYALVFNKVYESMKQKGEIYGKH